MITSQGSRRRRATNLEQAILRWIAAKRPSLGGVEAAEVLRREYSGAGFYAYLAPDAVDGWDRPPIDGPTIQVPGHECDWGSVLWLASGQPNCLDVYALGSHLPEHLDDFRLSGPNGNS